MATCRALEAEIEQTRTHAAHLLQALLREAFAPRVHLKTLKDYESPFGTQTESIHRHPRISTYFE